MMLTVADIMTTEVLTIRSSATVAQAIALMQDNQVRSLIVERECQGGVYGILTVRDIAYKVTATAKDPTHIRVCEIMQRPCVEVKSDLNLPEVAQQFVQSHLQRAPVIENGYLVGVVSVTDIIMKSNVDAVELPGDLSQRLETALRHQRLSWNNANQLEEEIAIACDAMAELRAETPCL